MRPPPAPTLPPSWGHRRAPAPHCRVRPTSRAPAVPELTPGHLGLGGAARSTLGIVVLAPEALLSESAIAHWLGTALHDDGGENAEHAGSCGPSTRVVADSARAHCRRTEVRGIRCTGAALLIEAQAWLGTPAAALFSLSEE